MKLFFKITLLYLIISLLVFVAGGIITHQVIKREIDLEQQRFLKERLIWALSFIDRKNLNCSFQKDKVTIIPLGANAEETEIQFSDTIVMHSMLQRMEPHIKLDVVRKVDDGYFKIAIYDLIVEEDDIADGVRESLIKVYLLLLAVVVVLSIIASIYLLKPFKYTLSNIQNFSLKNGQPILRHKSGTKEFDDLNRFIAAMTEKMIVDYQNLKEFTENASHEMQTPLTIAGGKLELLLESDNLTDDQMMLVYSAQNSLKRLSKLSKVLSLLAKIENKEFEKIEEIDLSQLISQMLFDFKELIELKSIELTLEIAVGVRVHIDHTLIALLINNLLQNAIRHNYEKGTIAVKLTSTHLQIKNTGELAVYDPMLMFERFKKSNQSKDSIGLGLAIVKKICEAVNYDIIYEVIGNEHVFTLKFSQ